MAEFNTDRIRELNDRSRQSFTGCRVVITSGIAELGDDVVQHILTQVRTYDQFTPLNDPYQEHDFGSFHYDEVHVFWKWDYYDLDYSMHSPESAGQTIFHVHVHLIPRRDGDVEEPRGGVRGVIPGKQSY